MNQCEKTHLYVHFVSIGRRCLLQACAYLVFTARQRHLRMLRINRQPGVRHLMLCPKDRRLKAAKTSSTEVSQCID